MNVSKQRGMTVLGWLTVVVVGASIVTLALRLGPHYIDFRTMQAVVEGLPAGEVHLMPNPAINELLDKRFRINNLRDRAVKDVVKIERAQDETRLVVAYEVREPLIFNADVVLVFRDEFVFD